MSTEREVLIAELKGKLGLLTPAELAIVVPGLESLRAAAAGNECDVFFDGDGYYFVRRTLPLDWHGRFESLHDACAGVIAKGFTISGVGATRGKYSRPKQKPEEKLA